jgi:predicted transcriptional regulator
MTGDLGGEQPSQTDAARTDQLAAAHSQAVNDLGRPEGEALDLRELFHRLTNAVPDAQQVTAVDPDTPAGEAIALMVESGFSQLPIVRGGIVLGSFSFRSFATSALRHGGRPPLAEIPVDEFREPIDTAHPSEELAAVFGALDRDGAIVVGSVDNPLGLVTPMDVLHYLYCVAEPFVQLGEIERSLREIVSQALEPDEVAACARVALAEQYAGREADLPLDTTNMTLGDLVSVVRHGDNYPYFAQVLGAQRDLVTPRLSPLPTLRNVVFHFRRELTDQERLQVAEARNWLLRKLWGRP